MLNKNFKSTKNGHNKVEMTQGAKKGFLKDKGYKPEAELEKKVSAIPFDAARQKGELSLKDEIKEHPRPEPTALPEEQIKKEEKRKREAKYLQAKLHKELEYRKLYIIRYTLVSIAILILLFSIILSYQNYNTTTAQEASLEENGYKFMLDLKGYEKLAHNPEYDTTVWGVNNYLKLTSEDIIEDFQIDFEFIVEVVDLSSYPIKYNRTIKNDLAWSSIGVPINLDHVAKDRFKICTHINIYVSPEEIHIASLELIIWK